MLYTNRLHVRSVLLWLMCLVLPLVLTLSGAVPAYLLPPMRGFGTVTEVREPVPSSMEGVARIGRAIERVPNARIVFPTALVVSVWLLSIVIVHGRARYLALRDRRAQVKLYDELANSSRMGYFEVNVAGYLASCNPAFERIIGSSDSDGRPLGDIGLNEEMLVPGEVVYARLRGLSGRPIPVLLAAMEGEGEASLQVIVAELPEGSDSDRKRASETLHAAEAKRAFLSDLNHELRTPLTVILGSASILESDVSSGNADLVDAIKTGGERLLTILESLMLLSELEADDEPERAGAVDLIAVVQELVDNRQAAAADKGIKLRSRAVGSAVYAEADPRGVRRSIEQLIDNALKYTDSGEVEVSCMVRGRFAEVVVKDTGCGIDPIRLESLLADFREKGSARHYKGGIGLSLARLIVEQMGGGLRLESSPDLGTVATVSLKVPEPSESNGVTGLAA